MSAVPQHIDWYAILNIPPNASASAIKAAHRQRARELHPDVNRALDATARMAEVNHARDVLLNPMARALFDRERSRMRARAMPPLRPTPQPRPASPSMDRGGIRFTFDHGPIRDEPEPEPQTGQRSNPAADWTFDPAKPRDHDWYAFLGVPPWATGNEIQAAIARLAPDATRASLSPSEREQRARKLRAAWEVLGPVRSRQAYDAARPRWKPRPGMPDLYRVVGVRPVASTETIGAAVARIARAIGPKPIGADRKRDTAIREAWWVLRDPDRRSAYDASRA